MNAYLIGQQARKHGTLVCSRSRKLAIRPGDSCDLAGALLAYIETRLKQIVPGLPLSGGRAVCFITAGRHFGTQSDWSIRSLDR